MDDVDGLVAMYKSIPVEARAGILRELVYSTYENKNSSEVASLKEKSECYSNVLETIMTESLATDYVGDLMGLVKDKDPDYMHWHYPEGCLDCFLIPDSEFLSEGEALLNRYLDYRENCPEYDVIHPSDYIQPKENDQEAEYKRLCGLFADFIKETRNRFFKRLVK